MKDRHSKVRTAKGLRDRRVRLSAPTAIQFFDIQDRLGYEQPSKAVDWLLEKASAAIDELRAGGRAATTNSGDAGEQGHYAIAAAAASPPLTLPLQPSANPAEPRSASSDLPSPSHLSPPPPPPHRRNSASSDRQKRRLPPTWHQSSPPPSQPSNLDHPSAAESAYRHMQRQLPLLHRRSPSTIGRAVADRDHDDDAITAASVAGFEWQRQKETSAGIGGGVGRNSAEPSAQQLVPVSGERRAKARERARERVMKDRSMAMSDASLLQSATTSSGRNHSAAAVAAVMKLATGDALSAAVNRSTLVHHSDQQAQLVNNAPPHGPAVLISDHHRLPEYGAAELPIHGDLTGSATSAPRFHPSMSSHCTALASTTADEILRQYNLQQPSLLRGKPILQTGILQQQSPGSDQDHHSGGGTNISDDAYNQHYAMNYSSAATAAASPNLAGATFLQDRLYNSSNAFAASILSPQFYHRQQQQQQLQQLNINGGAASSSPARGTLQSMNFFNANYNINYSYTAGQAQNNNLLQQYMNYNYQQQAQTLNAAANQAAMTTLSDNDRQQRHHISLQNMLADMEPTAAMINLNQTSHYTTPQAAMASPNTQYMHFNTVEFGGAARFAAKREAEDKDEREQKRANSADR